MPHLVEIDQLSAEARQKTICQARDALLPAHPQITCLIVDQERASYIGVRGEA